LASGGWHAEYLVPSFTTLTTSITFEKTPSDYAILKIHTLPQTGGDTLWASAYEAYDRLSPAYRTFLEGLTAVHSAQRFKTVAARHGRSIRTDQRGAPDNVGDELRATHPVIRTNPVTGRKGLFVNKEFTKRIVEVTRDESDSILAYLFRHISENHDLQVRFKWNKNDIAIWDNRSVFHTATYHLQSLYGLICRNDYEGSRTGDRVVSLGEHPYLDPASKSRRESLNA
jgi:alpha-ketoglutarate-dependent taurine dioxygenase